MDREPQPEPIEPRAGEEPSAEIEQPSIDALPERLGFTETEELSQLRGELVKAMASGAETVELATRYQTMAEEAVNQREGDDFTKAQIGLTIQMALIRRDGGRTAAYTDDLQDALIYAENMGYEDTVATLAAAIRAAQATEE